MQDAVVPEDISNIEAHLKNSNHEILETSRDKMCNGCGNVLELTDVNGKSILVMSSRAYNNFTDDQRKKIESMDTRIVHADISTLERIGDGSARCCIAELF
jgi:hypothetical protein